ncbi:MAG: RNA-binding S4 domain-containing protein [Bacteroidales bacterium]|jgi:ribosome-associated protein|nr:RNA-binding S4 domain-containing protein [Bacteroidales bacterium]MDD3165932.1 RNA-binding S4 domain-containing protein [Bacteroidales bacterium]MDD4770079.1 RNA-binding S4 domain-containing protein [Bacteroidales bacterium]HKL93468.1 RNA-binding S4 domain-containing protein [Bacteroidales bacterium]
MLQTLHFQLRSGEDHIPLIQLLKAVSVVDSGAEAQAVVMQARVQLNGQIELRKRAKVRKGDVVLFEEIEIHIQ